jgi:hypothetical protein
MLDRMIDCLYELCHVNRLTETVKRFNPAGAFATPDRKPPPVFCTRGDLETVPANICTLIDPDEPALVRMRHLQATMRRPSQPSTYLSAQELRYLNTAPSPADIITYARDPFALPDQLEPIVVHEPLEGYAIWRTLDQMSDCAYRIYRSACWLVELFDAAARDFWCSACSNAYE